MVKFGINGRPLAITIALANEEVLLAPIDPRAAVGKLPNMAEGVADLCLPTVTVIVSAAL